MLANKKILVVEDEADILDVIQYILVESGYQVGNSPNVQQFSSELERLCPDLILMDIRLPDGSGLDLCRNLKNNPNTSHIPVIIMSAHYYPHHSGDEYCGDDFIAKPFDIDFLLNKVKLQLSA